MGIEEMHSKSVKSGLAAFFIFLGLAATPTHAATFNIAFTETGFNDPGPDYFGTFEAPAGGGPVSLFSAFVDGIVYDIPDPDFGPTLGASELFFLNIAVNSGGIVLQEPLSATFQIALNMFNDNTWNYSSCNNAVCNLNELKFGTYSISAVSEVPLPAALPLLAAGLGAMGLVGWRRKRCAA